MPEYGLPEKGQAVLPLLFVRCSSRIPLDLVEYRAGEGLPN